MVQRRAFDFYVAAGGAGAAIVLLVLALHLGPTRFLQWFFEANAILATPDLLQTF